MCMEVEVSEWFSKLVYNLFRGLTTYLYRGYNPVAKYHGHPGMEWLAFGWCLNGREGISPVSLSPKKVLQSTICHQKTYDISSEFLLFFMYK